MSLTQKVAFNTLVQIIGKLITTATTLALVVVLTNYLGVSGYGEYATIFSYVGFFSVFVDFGLYLIAVREIAKNEQEAEVIVGNILSLRFFLAFIVFGLAILISLFMPYSQLVKQGIMLASIALSFVILTQAFASIFQAQLKMHFFVLADVIGRLTVLGLVLVFVKLGRGLMYAVLAYVVGDLMMLLIAFFLANRLIKVRFHFHWPLIKKLAIFAFPLGIAGILGMIQFKIDILLLSFLPLKGGLSNMHEVGLYGVAYKVVEVLVAFPGMFVGSVFPILSNYLVTNPQKAKEVFQRAMNFLLLVALPLVVGGFLLAPKIILLMSGPAFIEAQLPLRILFFAIGFSFLGNLFGYSLIALNLQQKLVWVTLWASIFNVVTNLILIPYFSYKGAALTTVATEILIVSLSTHLIRRYSDFRPTYFLLPKIALGSFLMGLGLFLANRLIDPFLEAKTRLFQLIILLALTLFGLLIYGFFALFLKLITKEDLKQLILRRENV